MSLTVAGIEGLLPISSMRGETEAETSELRAMFDGAKQFLSGFEWCARIVDSYFGMGIGAVVGVFLFRIAPKRSGVDEWLWVIVGDLPPAYLVANENPSPARAIAAYIEEMRRWVDAVQGSRSVDDLIPVNAPATEENAIELRRRLDFLRDEILLWTVAGSGGGR